MSLRSLSSATLLVGLIGLGVLLAQRSSDATILGRYSARYLALVAAYALVMAAAAAILTRKLPTLPVGGWIALAVVGFGLATWLPLIDYQPSANLALRLSAGWLVLAFLWKTEPRSRRWRALALALGSAILIVSLIVLIAYPQIDLDEGWDADLGWTFVQDHVLYTRMNRGVKGIPEQMVPVANVLPGYWMSVAGVGLLQVRLLTFWGGLLLLAVTYSITLWLYRNRLVALTAVLFLLASSTFLYTSHYFRLDIFLGLASALAFYLFLRSENRPALALLAGVILSAAVEIHQNALVLCAASALILVGWTIRNSLIQHRLALERRSVYFVIGGMVGAALFLILHVLPDPGAFVKQFGAAMSTRSAATATAQIPVISRLHFLTDSLRSRLQSSPFEAVIVVAALIASVWMRRTRPLAALLAALLIAYALIAPGLPLVYLIDFWWLIALIFAAVMQTWIAQRRLLVIGLCIAAAMPSLIPMIQSEAGQQNQKLLHDAQVIAAQISPDETVVAQHYFFFAMPNYPYLTAPFMADYHAIESTPPQGIAVWEQINPDVFVLSSITGIALDSAGMAYLQQQHYTEIAEYDDAGCCIKVYRRSSGAAPTDAADTP